MATRRRRASVTAGAAAARQRVQQDHDAVCAICLEGAGDNARLPCPECALTVHKNCVAETAVRAMVASEVIERMMAANDVVRFVYRARCPYGHDLYPTDLSGRRCAEISHVLLGTPRKPSTVGLVVAASFLIASCFLAILYSGGDIQLALRRLFLIGIPVLFASFFVLDWPSPHIQYKYRHCLVSAGIIAACLLAEIATVDAAVLRVSLWLAASALGLYAATTTAYPVVWLPAVACTVLAHDPVLEQLLLVLATLHAFRWLVVAFCYVMTFVVLHTECAQHKLIVRDIGPAA